MVTSSTPYVTIIILNFNGETLLEECLISIEGLDYPKNRLEVIIGDNNSSDNSVHIIKTKFSWVKVIQFDDNYGFCKPNNVCAKQAIGDYIVFLNNDTFVDKNWLKELIGGLNIDDGVICCASKILFPHLRNGTILNAAGGVIFPSGCGLYEGWMANDSPVFNKKKYTGFGCAAGVLIKKDFFIESGGFDEYYFYSGEEMDLGYRIWLHGYKVMYIPDAVMYHYMGKTGFRGKGVTPTIEFLLMRNNLYFIFKNFELNTILCGLGLYSLRVFTKIFLSLRCRNTHIPKAIFFAIFSILKDFPEILGKRRLAQSFRKISDRTMRNSGIISNFSQTILLYSNGMKNMKRFFGKQFYDSNDSVKLRTNKNGDLTFYKT